MRTARRPAVAGTFYPDHPAGLAAVVDDLLDAGPCPLHEDPVALVVPHAGYACSGPVAASAYRVLRECRHRVRRAVVLGPAHFRDIGGLAVPGCAAWSTPLGDVSVDAGLCSRLVGAGLARADDRAHAGEHSVEVQLPFLQRILAAGWSLLPVVARSVPAGAVADCIDALVGDDVMLLVSSDLSHYHDRSTAVALDRRTADALVKRDADAVSDEDACGAEVVRGLLAWAGRHDLEVELLDLATSADTCSGPGRVVGYGAFAVLRRR